MGDNLRVDVVIIGAGPAGLMAAMWMAVTGVRTLLVESRPQGTHTGRADGLESRTLEILDSFGLADKVWAEANHTVDIALWSDSVDGFLRREQVSANTEPGWSRFYESTLGQGRVEELMMKFVQSGNHVDIRRATTPTTLEIDHSTVKDHKAYPIRVTLEKSVPTTFVEPGILGPRSDTSTPSSESSMASSLADSAISGMDTVVEAKYLLGCDGAHSWVRKQLGVRLEGESSDHHWGVLDFIPITNFPDIRKRFVVKSKYGALMMVPREKRLVRVYVELSPMASAQYTIQQIPDIIMDQVAEIMQPYVIKSNRIEWYTTYKVGQRICPKVSFHNRLFLAGDAIHTHSPKAGQGMNVSMQDTFNLGWKIASVVHGASPPEILDTYAQERLPIAQRLLKLDRRICLGMCSDEKETRMSRGKFHEDHKHALREENTLFAGVTATYQRNLLISPSSEAGDSKGAPFCSRTSLSKAIILGARIPSKLVLNQSDSQAHHLQQCFTSNGQWDLIIFGGDISKREQLNRINRLAEALSHPVSYFQQLNKASRARGAVGSVGVYLVHSANRNSIDLLGLPEIFRPHLEDGSIEYTRVWVDNESYHHPGGGDLYKTLGIDQDGCMVLLRPDQHVAFLSSIDDVHGLEGFLRSFTCL
ncbi:FAD binding domain-containing protein [Aspergillus cavernicola]|uniref:FAD binding domain-containing protein n=1 Tax=Aspergillus cavernicola TaxID=176166 RepID=A0ABR4HU60_9EURO